MSEDIEKIAAKLSKAQREALLSARWIHPGGQDPICLVEFTDAWPEGVARFFSLKTDRLTPLGLRVREHLSKPVGGVV